MRRAIFFFIILVIATVLGVAVARDPGYLLIAYQNTTIEMPLWLAIITTVFAIGIIYLILSFIYWIIKIPSNLCACIRNYRLQKATKQTSMGLIALASGNWKTAEHYFIKALSKNTTTPALNYFAAAKAVQQQKEYDQRNYYLQQAKYVIPDLGIAADIAKAHFQVDSQQYKQGLLTLEPLSNSRTAYKYPHIFRLLTTTLLALNQWHRLKHLLPQLRRYRVFSESDLRELEFKTYQGILIDAVNHKILPALNQTWQRLPHSIKASPKIVAIYAEKLIAEHAMAEAESILYKTLNRQWDNKLIELYSLISGPCAKKQLTKAEKWLKTKPQDPHLLFTLGRLCAQNQLWGKARRYFEECVSIEPNFVYFSELAKLLEQLGDESSAYQAYKDGLKAALKTLRQNQARRFNAH